jgi:Up-regulated During Septation
VLRPNDVTALSRELRQLDERCDYLRRTHNSLRSGRRSLHSRMITYLKAPRIAQFSRESILKQEEALAELDVSIDDWVNKLEQAENRRTRVRQKLLEHVAAALTLQLSPSMDNKPAFQQTNLEYSKTNSLSIGQDTPPASPEQEAQSGQDILMTEESEEISKRNRHDVESIKIYADSNVYVHSLLTDVEQELDRMVGFYQKPEAVAGPEAVQA